MTNIFFFNEIVTNNYKIEILNLLVIFSTILGIYVIISKNPIISILFLIGLFGSISIYLILIGLNFLGLSYLIIYIGAISILFLFILMLINVRVSELQNNNNNSLFLAIMITIIFSYHMLYNLSFYNKNYIMNKNNEILMANSNNWSGNLIETNHISSIGNILYTNYNIWLIITSFILLLAMVGSIIITIKQK